MAPLPIVALHTAPRSRAVVIVVGAHYLPFMTLYGMWEYGVLAAVQHADGDVAVHAGAVRLRGGPSQDGVQRVDARIYALDARDRADVPDEALEGDGALRAHLEQEALVAGDGVQPHVGEPALGAPLLGFLQQRA